MILRHVVKNARRQQLRLAELPRAKMLAHSPGKNQTRNPCATDYSDRLLEFTILCAARTGEVLGARFDEFDLEQHVWVVPAERMKAGQEHRIPLSSRAVAIIEEMGAIRLSNWVFPGGKPDKPLSNMALLMLLRHLRPGITVHGFRSTFKDWASEMTSFPDHLSEMALAHVSADKVRAAYARSDLFRKRRDLMGTWAAYCQTKQFRSP